MKDEEIDALKGLLRNPLGDIQLEDLLRDAVGAATEGLNDDEFPTSASDLSLIGFAPVWLGQVQEYESTIGPLVEPARLIGSYGLGAHAQVWKRFVAPVARWADTVQGVPALVDLRGYPALVLMYTVALASVLRENYGPLHGSAVLPRVHGRSTLGASRTDPLVAAVDVRSVAFDGSGPIATALAMSDSGTEVTDGLLEKLSRGNPRHTPMSDHLHSYLRPFFETELTRDQEWDEAFERAEVLLDALATDVEAQSSTRSFRTPGGYGRYTWRFLHSDLPLEKQILSEVERDQEKWPPVAAGLFGGQAARAIAALSAISEIAEMVRRKQW